jgi:hypothetical protein
MHMLSATVDARRGGRGEDSGSDQKIRYSSGGPRSLDPRFISFFCHTHRDKIAARIERGEGNGRRI